MYDERDIIQRFLEKQYDIRYGHQRDTWHFEDEIEVVSSQGSLVKITDIMLDKNCFVKFHVKAFGHNYSWWECFNFAYGELSKVIEALPDADEIVRKNAINDISEQIKNIRIDLLLEESPFNYEVGGNVYNVYNYEMSGDKIRLLSSDGRVLIPDGVPLEMLTAFRDHINIELLHRTRVYQDVMNLLALEENLQKSVDDYDKVRYGVVTFTLDKTDVEFDLVSIRRDDTGNLVIFGCDKNNTEDTITLTEKDIKREYLVPILKWLSARPDIIDEHNSHNKDLVRKINTAWKDAKYYPLFGGILLALLIRDHLEFEHKFCKVDDYSEEWAMNHAHEIMEGVCDDLDLKCILNFIRYEEE